MLHYKSNICSLKAIDYVFKNYYYIVYEWGIIFYKIFIFGWLFSQNKKHVKTVYYIIHNIIIDSIMKIKSMLLLFIAEIAILRSKS